MSILTWIEEKKRLKLLNAPKYINPASDRPDLLSDSAPRGGRSSKGLWTRCDKCGVILYIKHLKENQRVCFGCTYHLQMSSQERIENLLDKESWRPFDETVSPCDPLEFHDQRDYTDRLRDAQDKTGLQDAIQTGTGLVDGIPVALGIMDFDFMGGSMGSVVGEKITRLIEYATQEGLTLLLVCASGGARMQEGVFSLMQMAKISSALQIYQSCANLLYISILTSPTTGGVTASFAMLGDIIFAEPKALIAFAGRRVIEQTLCEDLPEDFQTSEYMLHHGLVDLIVPRRLLRQALSESIRLYKNAPFKKPGRIPFGVQNPISFLTEEKLRRQCRAELDLGLGDTLNKNISPLIPIPIPIPNRPEPATGAPVEVVMTPDSAQRSKEITIDSTNIPKPLYKTAGFVKAKAGHNKTEAAPDSAQLGKADFVRRDSEPSNLSERSAEGVDNALVLTETRDDNPKVVENSDGFWITSQKALPIKQGASQEKDADSSVARVRLRGPHPQGQTELDFSKEGDQVRNSSPNALSSPSNNTNDFPISRTKFDLGASPLGCAEAQFGFGLPNDTISRQSLGYREILTSFQMMYQLFSKQMAASSTKDKNPMDVALVGEQNINEPALYKTEGPKGVGLPVLSEAEQPEGGAGFVRARSSSLGGLANIGAVGANSSKDASLLQKFRELAEGVTQLAVQEGSSFTHARTKPSVLLALRRLALCASKSENSVQVRPLEEEPLESSDNSTPAITKPKVGRLERSSSKASSNHTVPSSLPSNNNRDFLNKALELAATESVEWRAFYVHL
jgi:acetyl-CoA carboxylase carboxyl transferase subunit beta